MEFQEQSVPVGCFAFVFILKTWEVVRGGEGGGTGDAESPSLDICHFATFLLNFSNIGP